MEAAVAFLSKAVKPVLVGGVKLRAAKARKQFLELADASRYPVAVMPNAKGCACSLVHCKAGQLAVHIWTAEAHVERMFHAATGPWRAAITSHKLLVGGPQRLASQYLNLHI